MKRGVPPTALNARTGEFTPPGMTAQASSNSFAEMAVPGTFTSVPAAATAFTTGCSCRPECSKQCLICLDMRPTDVLGTILREMSGATDRGDWQAGRRPDKAFAMQQQLRVDTVGVQAMASRWGASADELRGTMAPAGLSLSCQA